MPSSGLSRPGALEEDEGPGLMRRVCYTALSISAAATAKISPGKTGMAYRPCLGRVPLRFGQSAAHPPSPRAREARSGASLRFAEGVLLVQPRCSARGMRPAAAVRTVKASGADLVPARATRNRETGRHVQTSVVCVIRRPGMRPSDQIVSPVRAPRSGDRPVPARPC